MQSGESAATEPLQQKRQLAFVGGVGAQLVDPVALRLDNGILIDGDPRDKCQNYEADRRAVLANHQCLLRCVE